jgi:glycine/D-amino acid oxidase-like deaminating enzyme
MSPDEIAAAYPFYQLDDIVLGSHNTVDEGYFDGATMFDWWRRKARQKGVCYIANDVVDIGSDAGRVISVTLASGTVIRTGTVINAAGPRAARVAQLAGLEIPVEPRPRYTFVFDAADPPDRAVPLTIDPSGVHFRTDGQYFMAGCPPIQDGPVDCDDFTMDHSLWEEKAWPAIANRVPAFERVRLVNGWVGHYAYNRLDQNAVVGPHPDLPNFIFVNGFSGHGFQQSPAMGRGVSELVAYGEFRSLDMTPLGVERIVARRPLVEHAVI